MMRFISRRLSSFFANTVTADRGLVIQLYVLWHGQPRRVQVQQCSHVTFMVSLAGDPKLD
jgi:hypothetical protein